MGFECAVVDRNETSDWFMIRTGVQQGCAISGFLFLLCLDGLMKATEDKRRGIRLNFRAMLEDLDFADDIALLLSTFSDLQKMTGRLAEEAAREALNALKCTQMQDTKD